MKRISMLWIFIGVCFGLAVPEAFGQPETILPRKSLVGLANAVSGSRPFQVLLELTGYNRDRQADEYAATWRETEIIARKAKEYGFSQVEILRYPRGPVWDGIKGQLWTLTPQVQKVIDFKDIPTVLAPGSVSGTYEGSLVWIEGAAKPSAFEAVNVEGKVVLTAAETGKAFRNAVSRGALGIVNMNSPRPSIAPDAILWSEIGRVEKGFAFNISARTFQDLRRALHEGPVTVRAVVEAAWREIDNEVITAVIPGDGSSDEWVYLTAHLFEGINKQGASDNGSGSVLILEAGRAILEALAEGHSGRPARNLRFVWVDEFLGTFDFIDSHPDEISRVIADINLDMAGQNTELNRSATRLYRMPDSRIHFVADVAQELFEWVGATNIEHVHERDNGYGFAFPLTDPYGTRDPFRYRIEPFYGSSDHQVFSDRGLPAVLFNNWPDMAYHSSHDRPDLMDTTQMKRAAFITAATALVVAGSPETNPIQVASIAFARGRARISDQLRQWTNEMVSTPENEVTEFYRDLAFAHPHWYERETRNLESVLQLARGATSDQPEFLQKTVAEMKSQLESQAEAEKTLVHSLFAATVQTRGGTVSGKELELTGTELETQRIIPSIREIPRWSPAAPLPGFVAMEIRNFINGTRSVWEIRNAVNSEYRLVHGTISVEDVVSYLRRLEEAGTIFIRQKPDHTSDS